MFSILAFEFIEFVRFVFRGLRLLLSVKSNRIANAAVVQEYCAFNRSIFSSVEAEKSTMILMDCTIIPQWIFVNSFFANNLAQRLNAEIVSYGAAPRDSYADALFNSFGCRSHLIVRLNRRQRTQRWRLLLEVMPKIKSKQDLYELTLDGVWIGIDIYESILRSGVPTVEVESLRTRYFIFYALAYYLYFMNLFGSGRVSAASLSHDCYVTMGLVSRIAYRFDVPVYFADLTSFTKTTYPHQLYERFRKYPEYFDALTDEEKLNGIDWAKDRIKKRLNGVVGINMTYQEKSAFTSNQTEIQTSPSGNLKIVVATHCFFDNPHCYGGMLFLDFYEWLCYLGEISKITDYDWYLKPHPDYLPGTLETLAKVCAQYPKFRFIDPATSFHQLRHEGVSVALTCYGSIGHELPLLGYKVINAGYNPHIAYKFNWHAETLEEYRELLLNLPHLGEIERIEDMYKFFFVSHEIDRPSNFLLESFDTFCADAKGDLLGTGAYNAFLKQKAVFQRKATKNISIFLDDESVFSVRNDRNTSPDADLKHQ